MHVYNPFNVRQFLVIYVSEMLICPRFSLCSADLKQSNVFHLEKSSWFCCPEVYIGVVPLICGGRNILLLLQPKSAAARWLGEGTVCWARWPSKKSAGQAFGLQEEIFHTAKEASKGQALLRFKFLDAEASLAPILSRCGSVTGTHRFSLCRYLFWNFSWVIRQKNTRI